MSLESGSVGAEDYKFENEKNLWVWSYAPHLYLRLEATLAATSITHQHVPPHC